MGSSLSSGYAAREAAKVRASKCEKGGNHDWENKGSWPSTWSECKKCGAAAFDK